MDLIQREREMLGLGEDTFACEAWLCATLCKKGVQKADEQEGKQAEESSRRRRRLHQEAEEDGSRRRRRLDQDLPRLRTLASCCGRGPSGKTVEPCAPVPGRAAAHHADHNRHVDGHEARGSDARRQKQFRKLGEDKQMSPHPLLGILSLPH